MSNLIKLPLKGTDIASAGTITVPLNGDRFDVTGTTTITSIQTNGRGIGARFYLQFPGAVTLTHGSNLNLRAAEDYTTAPGDLLHFEVTGSNQIRQLYLANNGGDGGTDVPTGGTTGQVLSKASGADFDTEWIDGANNSGGSFTVATVPDAEERVGQTIYVTDGAEGEPCIAVSNGSNWFRLSLGTAIHGALDNLAYHKTVTFPYGKYGDGPSDTSLTDGVTGGGGGYLGDKPAIVDLGSVLTINRVTCYQDTGGDPNVLTVVTSETGEFAGEETHWDTVSAIGGPVVLNANHAPILARYVRVNTSQRCEEIEIYNV